MVRENRYHRPTKTELISSLLMTLRSANLYEFLINALASSLRASKSSRDLGLLHFSLFKLLIRPISSSVLWSLTESRIIAAGLVCITALAFYRLQRPVGWSPLRVVPADGGWQVNCVRLGKLIYVERRGCCSLFTDGKQLPKHREANSR